MIDDGDVLSKCGFTSGQPPLRKDFEPVSWRDPSSKCACASSHL